MVRAYHHTHAEGLQCLPTIEHGCSTEKKKRHHEWVRLPAEQLLVANIPTWSVVDKFSPVTSESALPLAVPGHGDLPVGGSTFIEHAFTLTKVARNFLDHCNGGPGYEDGEDEGNPKVRMDARGAVGVSERNGVPCRREDNKPVINKLVRYSVVMFTFPIAVFYAAYHVFLGVSLLCHLLHPPRAIGRAQGRAQAAAYVYRHLMLAASSCRHARPSMKDHDDRVTYSGVLAVLAGTSVHAPHTHATPSRARPPARPPAHPPIRDAHSKLALARRPPDPLDTCFRASHPPAAQALRNRSRPPAFHIQTHLCRSHLRPGRVRGIGFCGKGRRTCSI